MTTLLTIMSVIGIISVCWVIAKYNRNDNLFWMLVISLLAGMAGGAIFNAVKKDDIEKKHNSDLTQVYCPTQVSPAICVDFYTPLGDARVSETEPASKGIEIPVRDSKIEFAPSMSYEEIRGQPVFLNPPCRGNPGMPFDTS